MKYTKSERIELGRKIYESGLSNRKAAEVFGIGKGSAGRYRNLYEQSEGIDHSPKAHINRKALITPGEPSSDSNDYSSMTKEELIEELMKSKIREARLKKGYMVKGAGATKEYILLDSKNTK